jgi:hypothetical protein
MNWSSSEKRVRGQLQLPLPTPWVPMTVGSACGGVERWIDNPEGLGSSPSSSTKILESGEEKRG